jgi:predicted Zn-dependent protease
LTRVRTNVAAKVKEENPAPDFSREEPQSSVTAPASSTIDKALWEGRARRISAPFTADPLVFRGEVAISVESDTRYDTNSEDSNLVTSGVAWRIAVQAATKAGDGMELPLYATYFARTADGLPGEQELVREAREMVAQLARLRSAPLVDPFTGPAILSGRAAGVFFHEIWLLSDAAYKRAVNVFAKKKAAFQNRSADESLPDFSREKPVERVLPVAAAPSQAASEWIERGRQISAVFLSAPQIHSSEVTVIEERGRRYYVNSEGFKTVTPIGVAALRVVADTQKADGAVVRDFFEVVERNLQDMPPVADLVARTREFASRLASARAAKVGDDYTGPVLLERGAGAQLIALTLAPALLALRAPEADNPALSRATQGVVSPFLSRIGSRVMAEGLSVADTPSLTQFAGRPVAGAYVLDDEGVAARDVTLVENGRLVTLLTSRVPQRNLLQSNGHGRGGSVQPGVLQVTSASAVAASASKTSYLELLKTQGRPFGYIVRSLANPTALLGSAVDVAELVALLGGSSGGPGAAPAGPLIPQIVKVTPDGAEEVVRGMRFGALTPNVFRAVLGASEERVLHNYRASPAVSPVPGSLGGGLATVSVIAPSFIIDDLEIQRVRDVAQKPPAVPSPLAR